MPTKRTRRLAPTKPPLRPELLTYFVANVGNPVEEIDGPEALAGIWRAHAGAILEEFTATHPGRRPWFWWVADAPEPRLIIAGHARVAHDVFPAQWRERFGLPPVTLGAEPLIVESQAAYLDRLGLLDPDERARLRPIAFRPERHRLDREEQTRWALMSPLTTSHRRRS